MKREIKKIIGIIGVLLAFAGIFFLSSDNEKYSSFGSIILLTATVLLVWWHVWFWMYYAKSKGYSGMKIVFLIIIAPPVVLLLLPKKGTDQKTSERRTNERLENMGLNKNKDWQEYYKIRTEEEEKIKKEIYERNRNKEI